MGCPLIQNEASITEKQSAALKKEEKPKKLESINNTGVSLIKQHWQKGGRNSTKMWFSNLSIQIFKRKLQQFVRKYHIT